MANVILYQFTGDNIKVDKSGSLTSLGNAPCEILNTDILNPKIKLYESYMYATYCYIPIFGRYYFVSNPETLSGKHCILNCHVDVLMTYKGGLYGSQQLVARNEQESNWNKELVDNCMPMKARKDGKGIPFGTSQITNQTSYIVGII